MFVLKCSANEIERLVFTKILLNVPREFMGNRKSDIVSLSAYRWDNSRGSINNFSISL